MCLLPVYPSASTFVHHFILFACVCLYLTCFSAVPSMVPFHPPLLNLFLSLSLSLFLPLSVILSFSLSLFLLLSLSLSLSLAFSVSPSLCLSLCPSSVYEGSNHLSIYTSAVDGRTDGWVYRRMEGCVDAQMHGWTVLYSLHCIVMCTVLRCIALHRIVLPCMYLMCVCTMCVQAWIRRDVQLDTCTEP